MYPVILHYDICDGYIGVECDKHDYENYLDILFGKWTTNSRGKSIYLVSTSKERELRKILSFISTKIETKEEESKSPGDDEVYSDNFYKMFDTKPSEFLKHIEKVEEKKKYYHKYDEKKKDSYKDDIEEDYEDEDYTEDEYSKSRSSSSNYYSSSSYGSSSSDNFPSPATPKRKQDDIYELNKQLDILMKRLTKLESDVKNILQAICGKQQKEFKK